MNHLYINHISEVNNPKRVDMPLNKLTDLNYQRSKNLNGVYFTQEQWKCDNLIKTALKKILFFS